MCDRCEPKGLLAGLFAHAGVASAPPEVVPEPCVLTRNSGVAGFAAALTRLPPAPADPPPTYRSQDLFQGGKVVLIVHQGREYWLRITSAGKLILTA